MTIWKQVSYIQCVPNNSKLTLGSCLTNQEQALIGARALLNGEHISEVPEHQIARIMACGNCDKCTVRLQITEVCDILRREFHKVAYKLENFDWYQHDNEIRAIRISQRRKQRWLRQKEAQVI